MFKGLIVISLVPVPVTLFPVTSIVSKVLSSLVFLIVIFPLSTSTASLKVNVIFAVANTPVALSDGTEEDRVGLVLSIVVKLSLLLVLSIPAYEFPAASSKAVASIIR